MTTEMRIPALVVVRPLQDLYVAHIPGGRFIDPHSGGSLHWIQVAHNSQATFVDDSTRANPLYISGGLTSIYGREVVNFYGAPQANAFPGATGPLSSLFMAEVFGGLKYGWQVQAMRRRIGG